MHHSPQHIEPCVGIVCFRGNDVLLIRRAKPPKRGQWSIPGGRIEFGETASAAALRELKEETGINAKLVGLIDVVDGIFPQSGAQPERHFLLCDYAALWIAGEPVAATDASHAEFVSPDRLAQLSLWDETQRIIALGRDLVQNTA